MSIPVEESGGGLRAAFHIRASRDVVWSAIANLENRVRFSPMGSNHYEVLSDNAEGLGARVEYRLSNEKLQSEIVGVEAWNAGRARVVDTVGAKGKTWARNTWELVEDGDGVHVSLHTEPTVSGFMEKMAWKTVVKRSLASHLPGALQRMKDYCESAS